MIKSLYRKIIGTVIALLIFYFIGSFAYKNWESISDYNWIPEPSWLVSSVFLLITVYILAACGWILTVRMFGFHIRWTKGISIYLFSLLGRYVPGGVWSVLGRIYLCRLEGVPDSVSGTSSILEQAYPIVSAGFIFAVSLLFWNDTGSAIRVLPALLFVPIFIVFLHPKPFLKIANPILSRMGKAPVNIPLSFNNMLFLTGYYSLYWLVTGTAFYFFICSFYPLDISYIPILSGIYAISFVAGYVTFFTPAGLGVREGSLTVLLSFFIPAPIAIGVALLSRLWLIGVELTILLILLLNAETRKMAKTALGW